MCYMIQNDRTKRNRSLLESRHAHHTNEKPVITEIQIKSMLLLSLLRYGAVFDPNNKGI